MEVWIIVYLMAMLFIGVYARVMVPKGVLPGSSYDFLCASRTVGPWSMALSIAATWIWAPALFVATQQAYVNGMAGLFWFTVPNIACLGVFGYVASKLRDAHPAGLSLSRFMYWRLSPRCGNLWTVQLSIMSACAFAVQLLAGGLVLHAITGIGFVTLTITMAAVALLYSTYSGMRGSILTDNIQMVLIIAVLALIVPWVISEAGWSTVIAGLGGVGGGKASPLHPGVLLSFGITATIGLLAGPFGSQSFWQRAYSVQDGDVRRSFNRSMVIFAVVPILMGVLGFVAAGSNVNVTDIQLANLATVLHYLPAWVAIPFVLVLLSGLVSTLDSALCGISSIAADREVARLRDARLAMLAVAVFGIVIANVPGMQILYLWLFYATFRSATLVPTILTTLGHRMSEKGVFWGVLIALLLGVPFFIYGKVWGPDWSVAAASIFTVSASAVIALIWRRVDDFNNTLDGRWY